MRTFLVTLTLTVMLFSSNAIAGKKRFAKVTFSSGETAICDIRKFDRKSLRLEVKIENKKRKIGINKISFLQYDTSASPRHCDFTSSQTDLVYTSKGGKLDCIVRKIEKDKLTVRLPLSSGKTRDVELSVDSISTVCLNPDVLNIERFEYGGGFNLIDESREFALTSNYAEGIEATKPMLGDSIVDSYLDSLGDYIASYSRRSDIDYTFKAINSLDINAFTVGGGKIYINRGLIEAMSSEEELAGVLAHEIGHNVGKHTTKQLSKQLLYSGVIEAAGEVLNSDKNEWAKALTDVGGVAAFFGLMKYSRDDEREADMLGAYNLYAADINPQGMVTLFETLNKVSPANRNFLEEWSATHPDAKERGNNISEELSFLDLEEVNSSNERFEWVRDYVSALPPPLLNAPFYVDTFAIGAGEYIHKQLTFDADKLRKVRVYGNFKAYRQGGKFDDVVLHIFNETNFINWSNNRKSTELLDTDRISAYDLDYSFADPGVYYIVFDNSYSIFTPKVVAADIYIEFQEK